MGKLQHSSFSVWLRASLAAQLVENPPAVQEIPVRSLGWEDPLEKGKAPPSVFQPGEFSMGSQGVRRDSKFHFQVHSSYHEWQDSFFPMTCISVCVCVCVCVCVHHIFFSCW